MKPTASEKNRPATLPPYLAAAVRYVGRRAQITTHPIERDAGEKYPSSPRLAFR